MDRPYWMIIGPGGKVATKPGHRRTDGHPEGIPRLGSVLIANAPGVTHKTLQHLAGAEELSQLNLGKIRITDDGLANLEGLRKLNSLVLQGVPITDRGSSHLAGLDVEQLGLIECPIDGPGLDHTSGGCGNSRI